MTGDAAHLLRECSCLLSPAFGNEAESESLDLVSEILNVPAWKLRISPDTVSVGKFVRNDILAKAKQRADRVPLQYITGTAHFFGLDYEVGPGVLIPRQDTERLAEEAYHTLVDRYHSEYRFLEFCAGSGCVGITLAAMLASFSPTKTAGDDEVAQVSIKAVLTEISPEAIRYATQNLERINPAAEVLILKHDLLADSTHPITAVCPRFQAVLANPPYIRTDELERLQAEIRLYEPMLALDGGVDGLLYYRAILKHASVLLEDGGVLLTEIGYDAADHVRALMEGSDLFEEVCIKPDYAGNPRVAVGIKRHT